MISNLFPKNHAILGSIMSLVFNDDFYNNHHISNIRNSIYRAVEHDKCFVHRVNGEILGYCTWGFFTRDEIERDLWDGDDVFSRDWSEDLILFFPKFQCRAGRREVMRFVKDIQDFMFKNYPDCDGYGDRLYVNGNTRRGKWHRKVA